MLVQRYESRPRIDIRHQRKQGGAVWLAAAGGEALVGREELVPPGAGVAALTPREVGGEIFDMNLDAGSVGGELVWGHAPFLPDEDGLVAIDGQRDLDGLLVWLVGLLGL
jgi:hypothetical protein